MTFHIVEFHADGGQVCIPGRRTFTDKVAADSFAERMRNEEGHSCGPESVRQYESETDPGREGDIYRADMTPDKYIALHRMREGSCCGQEPGAWAALKAWLIRTFGRSH